MKYKWFFSFVLCAVPMIIAPESFVVKKVKQAVVPIKDLCLEHVGLSVEHNPDFIRTLGSFMEQYGYVQQQWLAVLKDELEGNNHPLFKKASEVQLKKINDATQALDKKLGEAQKTLIQLTKELREYRELLCLAK